MDNANVNTLVQAFISSILAIGALQLVLNTFSLPDPNSSQFLFNYLLVNVNCKAVANHTYIVLSLNFL